MCPTEYDRYYIRHLPHVQPVGATFFVTCRLAGSIPQHILKALREEAERDADYVDSLDDRGERQQKAYALHRKAFGRWDTALDSGAYGPSWLRDEHIAQMLADSLHHRQDTVWDLLAFCIMPNHFHVVFTPLPTPDDHYLTVTAIMQSLKGYTAYKANAILHLREAFWQHESYDHWVRDPEELARIISYVISNPVKASLVEHWADWPWTYTKHPT